MERYFVLGDFNTWYDWRLILTAKDVTPPEPKTNYIEIDGMDGTLDLTEALAGRVTYKDRKITASFWTSDGSRKERERRIRDIISHLHGRKVKIIEPDDPAHYFYGRVKISGITNKLAYSEFSIEATCEPWRYTLEESVRRVEVDGDIVEAVISNNGVKSLLPVITVEGSVSLVHKGVITELTAGTYKVSDIRLERGSNVITVSGHGAATFTYREADL